MQKNDKYVIGNTKTGNWVDILYNDTLIDDEIHTLIKMYKQVCVPCN